MELLRIEGSRAALMALNDVPELQVVSSSAIDRGDGSWLVSAYARDGAAAERLRERGLVVRRLKTTEQVRVEWARASAAPVGYLSSSALSERLRRLARDHPDVCAVEGLPHRTHEGREVTLLRVGTGSTATVVVLGGVHAREWAPPDALLSLAEGLVGAYSRNGPMEYAEWIDDEAPTPITYGAWSVSAADVKRIVEGVTLALVPLVNPDGRDFTLAGTDDLHYMWRKNRRPPPAGHTGPWCAGVDLNRNFDIAWDFERYYNAAAAAEVQSSNDACDPQIYVGPAAASEPETRNVQSVVTQLRPSHFMDVHSYGRTILFPWGMDDDQSREPTQNFHNPDWDRTGPHRGRDGVGGSYGEYLPSESAVGHTAIGRRMRDAIRDQAGPDPTARRRSIYSVKQALGLYPTTGTSDDYCAGLMMLDRSRPPISAFCLECGIDQAPDDPTDNEGGFHPEYPTKFPKIEREIHAAVLALARAALR
jgi:Zinc carboxypeptidase